MTNFEEVLINYCLFSPSVFHRMKIGYWTSPVLLSKVVSRNRTAKAGRRCEAPAKKTSWDCNLEVCYPLSVYN